MLKKLLLIIPVILWLAPLSAQDISSVKLHAHNDYQHEVPFWQAFSNGFESIEVDVVLQNDTLFVAHEVATVHQKRTLQSLYFQPIEQALALSLWNDRHLQLMIDIKTDATKTLDKIIKTVKEQPAILKAVEENLLSLVISGNRPSPSEFVTYPSFILFDYQSLENPGEAALAKIAMISTSFKPVSVWNGKGRMVDEDLKKVTSIINKAHALNKPFRFWATPDSKSAWKAFAALGVDYINTDMLNEASRYLQELPENTYVTKTNHNTYMPTFKSDGKRKKVKNIILLVGDGMGFAQITSGMLANNNQLTITNIKNVGLSKTQSSDDFTTDSAAGGSALATGKKTKNRYIGVDPQGTAIPNIPEQISPFGFLSGIVTNDHLTGATPAAFYAHQVDRGMTDAIANDLARSPVSLVIGAGKSDFKASDALEQAKFTEVESLPELKSIATEKAAYFPSAHGLTNKLNGRGNYLPDAVSSAISFLSSKQKPFFLIAEGAFIDSGGHANNTGMIIEEVLDFDLAVEQALRFADQNNETLVIITADHETGGFSIPQGNIQNREIEGQFHTHDHTGIMVPVFAYGPHSQDFCGVYDNTAIYHKIMEIVKEYY